MLIIQMIGNFVLAFTIGLPQTLKCLWRSTPYGRKQIARIYKSALGDVVTVSHHGKQYECVVFYNDILVEYLCGTTLVNGTVRIINGQIEIYLRERVKKLSPAGREFYILHELGHAVCDPELCTIDDYRQWTLKETIQLAKTHDAQTSEARANTFARQCVEGAIGWMTDDDYMSRLVTALGDEVKVLTKYERLFLQAFMLVNRAYTKGIGTHKA